MKNKKEVYIIFTGIFITILGISLVLASFTLGNPASSIEKTYQAGEAVRGWINISFQNQDSLALLSGFSKSINILSFLDLTGASYTCFPADCEGGSYASSLGSAEKTLTFSAGTKKLIGVKLVGQVDDVNSLVFNVTALGSDTSCVIPLKIDVLNDDSFEWQSSGISNELCSITAPYGCYNEGDYTGQTFLITDSPYCAKTRINSGKKFKIGADILAETGKGGSVRFNMQINSDLDSQECVANANVSGSISCFVELESGVSNETQIEICISTESTADNGKYKIKYETVNACGSAGTGKYDFPIFIYPFKYSKLNSFGFNQNIVNSQGSGADIAAEMSSYIANKYEGDCDPECIIPIAFYSGQSQDILISNLDMIYIIGGAASEKTIYNLTQRGISFDSGFQILDLAKANFLTPFSSGSGEFILEIGNERILREIINITSFSKIIGFEPNTAGALVPTKFSVRLSENQENLTYIWNFGDSTSIETTSTNQVEHIYTKTGDYSVKVTIKNSAGNSSKNFSVKVIPPKEAISQVLTQDRTSLAALKSQISRLPEWVKTQVNKLLDMDGIEENIINYEKQYQNAFTEDSYVNLMKILLDFKVPSGLTVSKKIPKGALFLNKKQLNLEILEQLGAGNIDAEQNYDTAVNAWLATSMDAFIEVETYALDYNGKEEDFLSYMKVSLEPYEDLGEVYFIVNGDPNKIILNDENSRDIGEKAKAIVFNDLAEVKTIEILYPGAVSIENFPVYISPEFNSLDLGASLSICNFNGVCEKNLKEDYKNCRSDCKPYLLMLLMWAGLFLGFLVIYIALQEWYKRHYEAKLFPDRNQLFNVINFINNSLNQGKKKAEIFDHLKSLDWSGEQLNYAWNKFYGKRTGMWEIPVFKWVENRQVKRELEKRQNIPIQKPGPPIERIQRQLRPSPRRLRYR